MLVFPSGETGLPPRYKPKKALVNDELPTSPTCGATQKAVSTCESCRGSKCQHPRVEHLSKVINFVQAFDMLGQVQGLTSLLSMRAARPPALVLVKASSIPFLNSAPSKSCSNWGRDSTSPAYRGYCFHTCATKLRNSQTLSKYHALRSLAAHRY